MKSASSLLLFDGICNLCIYSIQVILKHEQDNLIQFAPLQSEIAQTTLEQTNSILKGSESIIFIEQQRIFYKSDAVIQISSHLKRPWRWIGYIRILPLPVRDFLYDIVAKYRYIIFGKKENCMVPTGNFKHRFL